MDRTVGLCGSCGVERRKVARTVDSRPCGFPFLGRERECRSAEEDAASAQGEGATAPSRGAAGEEEGSIDVIGVSRERGAYL